MKYEKTFVTLLVKVTETLTIEELPYPVTKMCLIGETSAYTHKQSSYQLHQLRDVIPHHDDSQLRSRRQQNCRTTG